MVERDGNSISVERFVDLVGAPLPERSQDIEQYIQSSFRTLAGQFAEQVTGADGVYDLDDLKIGIGEIAGRYGLTLPSEPGDIVPFLTQLGQIWVPDQFPPDFSTTPTLDPTITEFDPDAGYGVDSGGNPVAPIPILPPKDSSGSLTGSSGSLTRAKSILICSTGRPISSITIWNGYVRVDEAPSDKQYDKTATFPLQNGQCYNYGKRCTHYAAYGPTHGEVWTFHVEITP